MSIAAAARRSDWAEVLVALDGFEYDVAEIGGSALQRSVIALVLQHAHLQLGADPESTRAKVLAAFPFAAAHPVVAGLVGEKKQPVSRAS